MYLRDIFILKKLILIYIILFVLPLVNYSQNNSNDKLKIHSPKTLHGEKIFFTKHRVVSGLVLGDIYAMDPNGSNVEQITSFSNDLFITERPELSDDGSKLAFLSNYEEWKSTNYVDAFILNLSTGKVKRVTGYEKTEQYNKTGTVNVTVQDPNNYAISPSAVRISYRGCDSFVTGYSATLTVPANEEIWIKAEIARGKGDIEVVNVPEGENKSVQLNLMDGTITAESCSPSPNGDFLAVSRNSETISQQGEAFPWYKILIWDANQGDLLAEAGGLKLNGDKHPAYSPDGSMLAVCTGELFANSLAVLSTSNITATPQILVEGKRFFNQEFCSDPTWSPNSSEIVFVYNIMDANTNIQSNLYKVSVNGGTPVQLTYYSGDEIVSRPSYSPNGESIAFNRLKSNDASFSLNNLVFYQFTSDIYIIPSNGGSASPITNDGNAIDPTWGNINTAVDVKEESEKSTLEFYLSQNYPNPFNPSTIIEFTIPKSSYVNLRIFDVLGNEVKKLLSTYKSAGTYKINFKANNLSSGIYFYKLETEHFCQSKKMLLIK